MSAKTLTSLYGHPSGTILRDVSYDILTRLVQAGLATWDLTGGVEQVRPTINTRATFQEQQLFVPDNALDPDSGSSPVTAVVNPGGGDRLSAGGRRLQLPGSNLKNVVLFGDSITAQNTHESETAFGFPDNGYMTWAIALAGVDAHIVKNAGVGGDTTAGMLARVHSDVLSVDSDCVIEMGGINGITSFTPEQQMEKKIAYWEEIARAGRYVIALTTPPRGIGTEPTISRIAKLNNLIAEYWRGRDYGECIDVYGALADTTNQLCPYKSGYAYDSPSTHPSNLGAFHMGASLAPTLRRLFRQRTLVASPRDTQEIDATSNNLLTNPLFLNSGGSHGAGSSGTLAQSWQVLCTGGVTSVGSLGAANSGIGNKQVLTISSTASGYAMLYNTSIHPRLAGGDIVRAMARIKVVGATGLKSLSMTVTTSVGAGSWGRKSGNAQSFLPENFELLSPETVAYLYRPSASAQFTVRAEFEGSGGAVVEIERAEVRKQ